jgi:hypothetical protein
MSGIRATVPLSIAAVISALALAGCAALGGSATAPSTAAPGASSASSSPLATSSGTTLASVDCALATEAVTTLFGTDATLVDQPDESVPVSIAVGEAHGAACSWTAEGEQYLRVVLLPFGAPSDTGPECFSSSDGTTELWECAITAEASGYWLSALVTGSSDKQALDRGEQVAAVFRKQAEGAAPAVEPTFSPASWSGTSCGSLTDSTGATFADGATDNDLAMMVPAGVTEAAAEEGVLVCESTPNDELLQLFAFPGGAGAAVRLAGRGSAVHVSGADSAFEIAASSGDPDFVDLVVVRGPDAFVVVGNRDVASPTAELLLSDLG